MEELRKQVFDLVTDSPCYVCGAFCEFWDMQGHYCFLKNVHKTSDKCPLIDQILALEPLASLLALHEKAQARGYRLAMVDDKAGLPSPPKRGLWAQGYYQAQREMLQTGYVKEVK